MLKPSLISTCISLCFSTILHAEGSDYLIFLQNKIEQAVNEQLRDYKEGKVSVKAESIDTRLKLNPCDERKLFVFNPYKSSVLQSTTMGIRCEEETNHWTLYVPVTISVKKMVLAAKHPLAKLTTINADDVYEVEMDVNNLKQGYFDNPKDVIGRQTKYNLIPGSAFTPNNLEIPKIVHKGDKINIVAKNEGFIVKMSGLALQDGILGETIPVKNLSSKRNIDATIISNGEVEVVL